MTTDRPAATPWSLGVRCDRAGCPARFEGDFLVAENATLGERLSVALDHVRDKEGWQVVWPSGAGADEAETYCPAHRSGNGVARRRPTASERRVAAAEAVCGCPCGHDDGGSCGTCAWVHAAKASTAEDGV